MGIFPGRWAIAAAAFAAALPMPAAAAPDAPVGEDRIEEVIAGLRDILGGSGAVARLYYRASSCEDFRRQSDPLSVSLSPPGGNGDVLTSVRTMFAGDPRVRVVEEPPGIIRIFVDHPPVQPLQATVGTWRPSGADRYSALGAVLSVGALPEVVAAAKGAGMESPLAVVSILYSPSPDAPHLPPMFSDVTADGILDSVAATFGQIVSYAVCPDSRAIWLRNFPIQVSTFPRARPR